MHLIEVGLDHSTADVTLRERLAIPAEALPDVFERLGRVSAESTVISTCNRVEIYALVDQPEFAQRGIVEALAALSGLSADRLSAALTVHQDADVARHLFRVAAGLESMIVGEPEIAGQVRRALRAAEEQGAVGPVLRRLFADALSIAGRVRSDSGISREPVSVSATAVRLAERTLGGLAGKTALVIGAGAVGRAVARTLLDLGASRILVASRHSASAGVLADLVGGDAFTLDGLPTALGSADVVISATAAPVTLLTAAQVRTALDGRESRPLLLVDVAVPRDIDPAVAEIPGCTLFDVDDLAEARETGLAARRLQADAARESIERAVTRFVGWWHGLNVAPVVAELTAHAERVRLAEAERALARLGGVSERERQLVEAATSALVKKLLHRPIVELKRRGGAQDADRYVNALRELFALHGEADSAPGLGVPLPLSQVST
jgi:glutamyl-tRNA reductase